MAGVPADTGHIRNPLSRYVPPHHDSASGNAEFARDLVHQTASRGVPQQVHAEAVRHIDTLSETAHNGKAQNGRETLRITEHAFCDAQRMTVADTIRAARLAAELSQRVMAKKLRVSASAVAQWETGETLPSIGRRADIARLLRIGFMELLPEGDGLPADAIKRAIDRIVAKLPAHKQVGFLATIEGVAELLDNQEPDTQPPPETDMKRL